MGRGAKGVFALDVSSPATFDKTKVLWEYADGVGDPDLGHMLGRPVLAKMKNGDWAVILGNGYNSTSQKAALYIFKLSDGTLLRKIDTGVAGDNGMASPGVHLDANGVAETVYAGDLKGNVWKFDVSSANNLDWGIPTALGTSPIFRAKDAFGNAQPITAPIRSVVNTLTGDANAGKRFLHFGTGSDFQVSDPSSSAQQSWYGLIDEGSVIANRSGLISRTMTSMPDLNGKRVRSVSTEVAGDMLGKTGFVIDLPESGERIVTASNYYLLAEPVLIASSVIPTVDLCEPGGIGYVNAINPFTGARLTKGFFDVTGDGKFADDIAVSSVDLDVGKPGEAILIGNRLVVGGSKAVIKDILINKPFSSLKGRISWREIIRD
jgi:type IV pilus assembly protein PilY1